MGGELLWVEMNTFLCNVTGGVGHISHLTVDMVVEVFIVDQSVESRVVQGNGALATLPTDSALCQEAPSATSVGGVLEEYVVDTLQCGVDGNQEQHECGDHM